MRAHRVRGFTILELITAVAIVGIVAALAIPTVRYARRNASVTSAAFELTLWLDGLRTRALRDQQDLVAVIVDVPGADAAARAKSVTACGHGADAMCGRYFLLRPLAGFVLNGFDPDKPPFEGAAHVETEQLPPPVRFHRRADGSAAPPPFGGITAFDAELVGKCGARTCVAVRFRRDGAVVAELPGGGQDPLKSGIAVALGSYLGDGDPNAPSPGADQRGILVSFPTGIVRSYPLAP